MANYAENADKVVSKAVPTIKTDGTVKKWEIEVTYSYPAAGITTTDTPLRRKFNQTEDVEYLNKKPEEFTKAELLSYAPIANLNMVFDSTYESVVLPPTETRHDSFDINTLS
jgi:hypothetical protein